MIISSYLKLLHSEWDFLRPGMSNDIKQLITGCSECSHLLPSQMTNPSVTHPPSTHMGTPMQHVGVDLFSHLGSTFLVCVNHWSGYPVYEKMTFVSTPSVVKCLKNPGSIGWGWPKSICSDGWPQFTNIFNIFGAENNIIHELAAPYNPKCNGLAETAVKNVKKTFFVANAPSLPTVPR